MHVMHRLTLRTHTHKMTLCVEDTRFVSSAVHPEETVYSSVYPKEGRCLA